jgi:hypothetical protein
MGAHRKPKTKPTAFAAVVTAAIVVPAGTAAAATYGGLGSTAGDRTTAAGSLLGAKARTAASSAAKATPRITLVTVTPTTSASTAKPSASPKTSPSTSAAAPASTTAPASPHTSAPAASASPSAAKTKNPYANVTLASLEPTGLYGSQQHFTPTSTQWANARTIVAVAKQRGLPLYAAVIATATAMQESSLINLTTSSNYDSLGLFQQRPSMGWGTAAQVTDPTYATNAFLTALAAYAPNYATQALWVSAQAVQRSGLPTAYARWEDQAAKIVLAIAHSTA